MRRSPPILNTADEEKRRYSIIQKSREAVQAETSERKAKRHAQHRETCTLKNLNCDQLEIAAKMLLAEAARTQTARPPKRDPPRVRQLRTPGAPRHAAVCQAPPRYNVGDVTTATVIASDISKLMALEESPLQRKAKTSRLGQWEPEEPIEDSTSVLNYQYVQLELAKLRLWS